MVHLDQACRCTRIATAACWSTGPWGIYFRMGRTGTGITGGGLPVMLDVDRAGSLRARQPDARRRAGVRGVLHVGAGGGDAALPRPRRRVAGDRRRRHRRPHAPTTTRSATGWRTGSTRSSTRGHGFKTLAIGRLAAAEIASGDARPAAGAVQGEPLRARRAAGGVEGAVPVDLDRLGPGRAGPGRRCRLSPEPARALRALVRPAPPVLLCATSDILRRGGPLSLCVSRSARRPRARWCELVDQRRQQPEARLTRAPVRVRCPPMRIRGRLAGLAATCCVALALTAPAAAAPLPRDFFGVAAPDSFDASPAFQQGLLG